MADFYAIETRQNSTYTLEVIYKDSAGDVITTMNAAQLQIKTNKSDAFSAAILALTNTGGIALTAGAGKLVITITDEQTAAISAGNYVYDLVVSLSDGTKQVLLEGDFTVQAGVTSWQ